MKLNDFKGLELIQRRLDVLRDIWNKLCVFTKLIDYKVIELDKISARNVSGEVSLELDFISGEIKLTQFNTISNYIWGYSDQDELIIKQLD